MDAKDLLATITNLIEQAKRGEIDPWDVEVVEVIDRYLEFMSCESTTQGYESDLYQSGQAFLSASMLVLFKANTLMELSNIDSDPDIVNEDVIIDNDIESHSVERLQLERQLRRRTAAMPPPKRRVTLQELIDQLQIMASQLKGVEKSNTSERPKRQPSMKTMKAALELAHQENLTQVAVEVEQVLHLVAKQENSSEPCWGLEELVQLWSGTKQTNQGDKKSSSSGHDSEHGNLVSVFWALLLLCAQSKVELFQEEFYQEVKVRLSRQTELHPSHNP